MPSDLPASAAAPSRISDETLRERPGIRIRLATGSDDHSIRNLIARCPEAGGVTLGFRLVGEFGALRGRFPTTRIHLACSADGVVVGMQVSDMTHVLIGGRIVRGARLSFLRTDPSFRRRGIARALVQQAERDARSIDGAEVCWTHIMDGNRASHATLAGAGYRRGPSGSYKLVDPRRCAAPPLGSRIRIARDADLPWLVSTLNDRYRGYDFWQPFTVVEYGQALERWVETGGAPRLWILAGTDDRPLAAAFSHGNGHALVSTVEKVSPWLRLVNAIIRLPIGLGMPLRITTVADIVVDPTAPKDAAAAVVRHAIRDQRDSADFVVLMRHANEPGDLAYRSVTGVSIAVDVVYKDCVLADRPSYIEPW